MNDERSMNDDFPKNTNNNISYMFQKLIESVRSSSWIGGDSLVSDGVDTGGETGCSETYSVFLGSLTRSCRRVQQHCESTLSAASLEQPLSGPMVHAVRRCRDLLRVRHYQYTVKTAQTAARLHDARVALLDCWEHLLQVAGLNAVMTSSGRDVARVVFAAITGVMSRPEFDAACLQLDVHGKPTCPSVVLHAARRYRRLLVNTHSFVCNQISQATHLSSTLPVIQFTAQVLSLSFFRLPEVGKAIMAALASSLDPSTNASDVELPTGDRGDASAPFVPLGQPNHRHRPHYHHHSHSGGPPAGDRSSSGHLSDPATHHQDQIEAAGASVSTTDDVSAPSFASGGAEAAEDYARTFFQTKVLPRLYYCAASGSPTSLGSRFPNLLRWDAFHAALRRPPDPCDEQLAALNDDWLQVVVHEGATGKVLFFLFFKEWLRTVLTTVHSRVTAASPGGQLGPGTPGVTWTRPVIHWPSVPGFVCMVTIFLAQMARLPMYYKSLMDCSCILLHVDPGYLNLFMRRLFAHCRVHENAAVLVALGHLDTWLTELKTWAQGIDRVVGIESTTAAHVAPSVRSSSISFSSSVLSSRAAGAAGAWASAGLPALPPQFDVSLLVEALRRVFETDHHQLIGRALSLLYDHADGFSGQARLDLFGGFLLKKWFYRLFLHWESGVRVAFQHLVVFRLVRQKRSVILRKFGVASHFGGDGGVRSRSATAGQQRLPFETLRVMSLAAQSKGNGATAVDDDLVDLRLFSQLETLLLMMDQQAAGHSARSHYNRRLEVYVPRAKADYRACVTRYSLWESTGGEPPCLSHVVMARAASLSPSLSSIKLGVPVAVPSTATQPISTKPPEKTSLSAADLQDRWWR